MHNFIKNNLNKIIIVFLLLQPILDLITGISIHTLDLNITIGIVIRMLFLLFLMFTTTFIYKKKLSLYTYIAVTVYSLLYLIGIIIYKDGVVFYELQGLLKTIYFPLVLVSLYDLKDEYRVSKMTLFTVLFTYLVLILIPNVLGLGFESYKITKSGSLGFFNAANEISGIISLLTPVMFIILKELKNKILKIVFVLIYLIVILTIGTKTPLLTLLLTIGFSYLYYIIYCIKKKTYKNVAITGSIIVVACASLLLIMPKTNFYKNIKVHLDYLEVDNILDVFKEKELVDHFIFSQRLTFLEHKAYDYTNSSTYEKLFGIGYTENQEKTKLIEMDYFDIYYSHGLIGFILLTGIYFYILYKVIMNIKSINYENYMIRLSTFLILVLSLFTGHIITAPAVSIIAIIIILDNHIRSKKDLMFATVHFDMGGIETSLTNLLNLFDYNKYNVTVVLEEKRGIFLPRVNKNAKVEEVKVSNHKNIIVRKLTNLTRKLIYTIFNYNNYDFGCCYATYSLSSNVLARVSSKNTAYYVHSNYKYIYNKEELMNFFNTRKIHDFRKIVFVAQEAKEDFLDFYPEIKDKCEVFANFIDVDLILKKSEEKIDIAKPKNKKLLVFVGRLDDHAKKLSRAINLVDKIDELALWIIGDGPDRKMYEDLVKKNKLESKVKFLGGKENPYPYMKQSDYVILTSDYEGFPLTYLEAITLNKEIITTIDVSDSQLNIGKDFAYIVSKDETKMVNEVKKILKDKGKLKKVDFKKLQAEKLKRLEKIFDEVI